MIEKQNTPSYVIYSIVALHCKRSKRKKNNQKDFR